MKKEKIIAFLEQRLTAAEEKAINDKIKTDANFAAEVKEVELDWRIQLMTSKALLKAKMKEWETASTKKETPFFASKKDWQQAAAKATMFSNVVNTGNNPPPVIEEPTSIIIPMWQRYLKPLGIAASILFLSIIGVQQWSDANYSNKALMSDFYDGDLALSRTMGAAETTSLSNIETAIQQGQYVAAIQEGANLLAAEIDETTKVRANYLMAQAYQRQKDYPNAIRHFEVVENLATGRARKKAQINGILLQVANGNKAAAIAKISSIKNTEADNLGTVDLQLLENLEKKLTHPLRSLIE